MSFKRILGITVFGVLFIAAVIGVMLFASFLRRDTDAVLLPELQTSPEPSGESEPDALNRVEVTRETVQAVVSELSRPDTYSRDVAIETFWADGHVKHDIGISVTNGTTSLRIALPDGVEKRIIVSPDALYIWYRGDRTPYTGAAGSLGDGHRAADEWQMLVTYEDLLLLDQDDIIEAGYTEFGGEDCIYAEYRSPLLGYTKKYYVSIELGLVTGAEEYDENGNLVYLMSAGNCVVGESDPAAFTLPDGTVLVEVLHE